MRVEPAASRRFVTSLAVAGCGLAPEARSVGLTLADSEGAVRLALAARGTTLDHAAAAESMLRHAGPVAVPVRAQPANGGSASQVVTLPVGRSGEPG